MKLTAIQKAQAELLWGYIQGFQYLPQSLPEMLRDWSVGFPGRDRKKDLEKCLNYLAECGRIRFVTIDRGSGRGREIGFTLAEGKDKISDQIERLENVPQ